MGYFVGTRNLEYYAIYQHRRSRFLITVPAWWREYESSRHLYVLTHPVFAYHSISTLRTTQQYRGFCVAISECCVLALFPFLLYALIGALSALRKVLPSVVDLVSEGVQLPTPFLVHEIMDYVGFFKIILQCSFDEFLVFLAYRHSAESVWKDVYFLGWVSCKLETGEILCRQERLVRRKKRHREMVLVTEAHSIVNATSEPSERLTLNDAQEKANSIDVSPKR